MKVILRNTSLAFQAFQTITKTVVVNHKQKSAFFAGLKAGVTYTISCEDTAGTINFCSAANLSNPIFTLNATTHSVTYTPQADIDVIRAEGYASDYSLLSVSITGASFNEDVQGTTINTPIAAGGTKVDIEHTFTSGKCYLFATSPDTTWNVYDDSGAEPPLISERSTQGMFVASSNMSSVKVNCYTTAITSITIKEYTL